MKVSDFMNKNPVTLDEDRPIRDAVRLIFNLGVSAILVIREKRLTGIITQQDILERLFPSVKDFMEDFTHSHDFVFMEEKFGELVDKPIVSIMTKPVKTVSVDTLLMRAQSIMLLSRFTHLPVVDEDRKLKGVISQGDIFRALVSSEIPYDDHAEYHDWLAHHDDMVVRAVRTPNVETENLITLFRKHNISRIVDVGSGPGRHATILATEHFHVVGIESSKKMYQTAVRKVNSLSPEDQAYVELVRGQPEKELKIREHHFDAAIFMGNALAHLGETYKEVLLAAAKSISKTRGMMVFQLINFEKIFKTRNRFVSFHISPSALAPQGEYAFLEFYDPPRTRDGLLTLTMNILSFNGRRWTSSGVNSTPVADIKKDELITILKKEGFKNVKTYGSAYKEPLFEKPFDPTNSDWLNVVAEK